MRALRRMAVVFVALVPVIAIACNEKALQRTADAGPGGISSEQAAKTVAKLGDTTITLGEFAEALSELPEFERVRYQSLERRKDFLRNMIDARLLAEEAKKEGLENDPTVQEEIRQVLVAWMRGKIQAELPAPEAIPDADVRAFYDAHVDDYREPERRRVALIEMRDEATATKAAEEAAAAAKTGATAWGAVVKKYSSENVEGEAPELAGDIGFVTPLADTHPQANARATKEVRAIVFAMKDVNEVSAAFKDAFGWHVARLVDRQEPREEPLSEVERSIRIRLRQEMRTRREQALVDETKKALKVEIDDVALAAVANSLAFPQPSASGSVSGSASSSTAPSTSPSGSASSKPPKP